MASLRHARRRVYTTLIVFLVVDIAAAAVLFSPLAGSGAKRQAEFDTLRSEVQRKMRLVVPPDQIQSRVDSAREQIAAFDKERIPAQSSEISTELGKLASENRVRIVSANYEQPDPDVPGLTRIRISANVVGDYLQEVKFINALERSRTLFIIDSVTLGEQQGGTARLTVTLETYLRGEA